MANLELYELRDDTKIICDSFQMYFILSHGIDKYFTNLSMQFALYLVDCRVLHLAIDSAIYLYYTFIHLRSRQYTFCIIHLLEIVN